MALRIGGANSLSNLEGEAKRLQMNDVARYLAIVTMFNENSNFNVL